LPIIDAFASQLHQRCGSRATGGFWCPDEPVTYAKTSSNISGGGGFVQRVSWADCRARDQPRRHCDGYPLEQLTEQPSTKINGGATVMSPRYNSLPGHHLIYLRGILPFLVTNVSKRLHLNNEDNRPIDRLDTQRMHPAEGSSTLFF